MKSTNIKNDGGRAPQPLEAHALEFDRIADEIESAARAAKVTVVRGSLFISLETHGGYGAAGFVAWWSTRTEVWFSQERSSWKAKYTHSSGNTDLGSQVDEITENEFSTPLEALASLRREF